MATADCESADECQKHLKNQFAMTASLDLWHSNGTPAPEFGAIGAADDPGGDLCVAAHGSGEAGGAGDCSSDSWHSVP